MGIEYKSTAIFVIISTCFYLISADTYSVYVGTEEHVNLVSPKFLSFTIDPKYLFTSSEKYNSKECLCMATSLTPAYIRIAGPSTSHLTIRNNTIAIDESGPQKLSLSNLYSAETDDKDYLNHKPKLEVKDSQWAKFVQWAKNTGFDLVFALNSDEKTASGMWDPNPTLDILTAAEKANIGDVFWQLGYECTNQSIEEYLNDLETLRVITETFPSGRAGRWGVVGGDVTRCLHAESKSDFKDYVTLSNEMMDAVLLNGNSSTQELERMSEKDRLMLLKMLSNSDTPLWLTEHSVMLSELERAADWMTSLGYSARNGFSVHYRELIEREMYEPTLSFYMALLFKNLVGERVLSVELEASQAVLFAHCASLRRRPVPGALAFYGVNLADEPARFSVKMTQKEEGGDIMQFILGHDRNGNIVVNGRPMYYEGDIRPVVKRVRPYKTLIINLPPKSFGFWVLANTQIQACYEEDNTKVKNETVDTVSFSSTENDDVNNFDEGKRSLQRNVRDIDKMKNYEEYIISTIDDRFNGKKTVLKERLDYINNIAQVPRILKSDKTDYKRIRRQTLEHINDKLKKTFTKFKTKLRSFDKDSFRNNIFNKLKIAKDHVSRSINHKDVNLKGLKRSIGMKRKRNSKDTFGNRKRSQHDIDLANKKKAFGNNELKIEDLEDNIKVRNRRSTNLKNKVKHEEESSENEINVDGHETMKIGKILHKLKKLSELPLEVQGQDDDYDEHDSTEGIILKTKVSDDGAMIDISEKSPSGLLRSTLQDILSLLADFNKNINRFWTAITLLE